MNYFRILLIAVVCLFSSSLLAQTQLVLDVDSSILLNLSDSSYVNASGDLMFSVGLNGVITDANNDAIGSFDAQGNIYDANNSLVGSFSNDILYDANSDVLGSLMLNGTVKDIHGDIKGFSNGMNRSHVAYFFFMYDESFGF